MQTHRTSKDQASIERVCDILAREAKKLGESDVGVMFRDWAGMLSGEPLPWAHPWQNVTG